MRDVSGIISLDVGISMNKTILLNPKILVSDDLPTIKGYRCLARRPCCPPAALTRLLCFCSRSSSGCATM